MQIVTESRAPYFAGLIFLAGVLLLVAINPNAQDAILRLYVAGVTLAGIVVVLLRIGSLDWVLRLDDTSLFIKETRRGNTMIHDWCWGTIDYIQASRQWVSGNDGTVWITMLEVVSAGTRHEYELPALLSVSLCDLQQLLVSRGENGRDGSQKEQMEMDGEMETDGNGQA
jgi:hypothetical protein